MTPRATAILLLAANAPDIDVISAAGGRLAYLRYHRYLTHALIVAPVMALLCVLAVRLATRKPLRWRKAFPVALVGVASHLALDFTNVYGIRLLLPFSERWLRLDITPVIDPWIWAILLIPAIAWVTARFATGGGSSRAGRAAAILALALLGLYEGARGVLHQRALAILEAKAYPGPAPLRVAAFPAGALDPLQWRGLAASESAYIVFHLDLRGPFDPTATTVFRQAEKSAALDKAARLPDFRDFLRFTQFPLWTVIPLSDPPGGARVELSDMRFGGPGKGFAVAAILDAESNPMESGFSFFPANSK